MLLARGNSAESKRYIVSWFRRRGLLRGFAEIVLHAQVVVAGFYRRLGYVEEGDPFDEAGIPHIGMRKKIR